MYCSYCGRELNDSDKFCPYCGERITDIFEEDSSSYEKTGELTPIPLQDEKEWQQDDSADEKTDRLGGCSKFGIAMIVLGMVCGVLEAIICTILEEHYRGRAYISGYYNGNGKYIIQDSGTIGGNAKAVSYFGDMKIMMLFLFGVVILMGIVFLYIGRVSDKKPVVKMPGRVIDLDEFVAVIELDDGTRLRLTFLMSQFILAVGDRGLFEWKGQRLIGFERY